MKTDRKDMDVDNFVILRTSLMLNFIVVRHGQHKELTTFSLRSRNRSVPEHYSQQLEINKHMAQYDYVGARYTRRDRINRGSVPRAVTGKPTSQLCLQLTQKHGYHVFVSLLVTSRRDDSVKLAT